jgi:hypothetical protein
MKNCVHGTLITIAATFKWQQMCAVQLFAYFEICGVS